MASVTSCMRVLVTGGNDGIGLALCSQLLFNHGCHVFLCSRDITRGQAAIDSLTLPADLVSRCTLVELDVSNDASVLAAAEAVAKILDSHPLYAIVNNAGTGLKHGTTAEMVINTNLYGPKRVVEAFLPLLCTNEGRIVNVGSGVGPMYVKALGDSEAARDIMNPTSWDGIDAHVRSALGGDADTMGGYGLSKAALTAYTMLLAQQHPHLRCSVCSPGFINTKMTGMIKF